jgi:hypothetical protein
LQAEGVHSGFLGLLLKKSGYLQLSNETVVALGPVLAKITSNNYLNVFVDAFKNDQGGLSPEGVWLDPHVTAKMLLLMFAPELHAIAASAALQVRKRLRRLLARKLKRLQEQNGAAEIYTIPKKKKNPHPFQPPKKKNKKKNNKNKKNKRRRRRGRRRRRRCSC